MQLLVREEKIVEDLRRWVRRANEALNSAANLPEPAGRVNGNESASTAEAPDVDFIRASLGAALSAADKVLNSIDGQPREDHETAGLSNGSVARLVLAQDTLASLVMDLQNETEARLALMRQLGTNAPDPLLVKTLPPPPNAVSERVVAPDTSHKDVLEANDHGRIQAGDDQVAPSEKEEFSANAVIDPDPTPTQMSDHSEESTSITSDPPQAVMLPSSLDKSSRVPHDNPELINKLGAIAIRYEDIQRQLRECHRSLATLKVHYLSNQPFHPAQSSPQLNQPLITTVIERLDDYAEDAIVEVEIRAADDTRLAEGFKTLLSISESSDGHGDDTAHTTSLLEDIEAFLDESHVKFGVNLAKDNFMKKVDDLQHDVATVKFALHQSSLVTPESAHEGLQLPEPSERPVWSRWFSSPRVPSSRPTSPTVAHQSFGAVMTSSTLRSSSSLSLKDTQQPTYSDMDEMIKQLDFRISMPFNHQPVPPETGSGASVTAPWARVRTVSFVAPRPRAVSGTLGLNASARYDASKLSQSYAPSERIEGHQDYDIYDDDNSDVE